MPISFLRHPKYTIITALGLCTIFYLLAPSGNTTDVAKPWNEYDSDLPLKIDKSHLIYDKMLKDRQAMIKKFGPHPRDILKYVLKYPPFLTTTKRSSLSFPPDKSPWPAYTICKPEFVGLQKLRNWRCRRGLLSGSVQLPSRNRSSRRVRRWWTMGLWNLSTIS